MLNIPPILAIVLPCYNEEAVLPDSIRRLLKILQELSEQNLISATSFCYLVDDGSEDRTWEIISENHRKHKQIKALKLAKNVGHQNAVLAGLLSVYDKTDCAISIDADLQDDIQVIKTMIQRYTHGDEIVFGVRSNREIDKFFKRFTAQLYYRLMNLLGVKLIYNHADFRLLGKKALRALNQHGEYNIFLRGLCNNLGFSHSIVEYKRLKRHAGVTKYPIFKMFALAWEGITSFSIVPLRFFSIIGAVIFATSIIMSFWVVFIKLSTDEALPGWASTTLPIYFLGGVQLLGIGIIGEYLGKIFLEVKGRPRFIKDVELDN